MPRSLPYKGIEMEQPRIPVVVTVPNEQGAGTSSQVIPFRAVPRQGDLVRVSGRIWQVSRVIWGVASQEWDAAAEIACQPLAPAPQAAPEPPEDVEDEAPEKPKRNRASRRKGSGRPN